ncbi:MAG: hypothetical protein ACJ73E_08985 [Mycobacteriales bacterium]
MSRRPSLPGAAELFRSTGGSGEAPESPPAAAPTPADGRRPAERLARLGVPREDPGDGEPERAASVTPLSGAGAAGLASYPDRAVAEPSFHGLRPPVAGFDDDLVDPALRRAPARIRQTRRQPLRGPAERRPSGREKHDEKITVYCSAEELFELERARLALRGEHGLVVDRGRIVREAVAVVLADLEAKGESSILVRRLRES